MFDGLIIWLGYVISVAFGLTLLCGLLLAGGRRWGPPKIRIHLKSAPYGCALPVLFVLVILIGVGWALLPVEQPESLKTVAAYSIPIASENDRNELLQLLREAAKSEGMHMDAAPRQWLETLGKDIPQARMTIHAAVWMGADDKEPVADIMDLGHPGQAWITFSMGTNPKVVEQFRDHVMQSIKRRWPDTLSLPVLPTGGVPLYEDLVRTPEGYKIKPEATSKYASEEPKT
jgi:hypothetical protein